MRHIVLTVAFTDETGATRLETRTTESSYAATLADEHRLVHIVEAELRVAVGEQAQPKVARISEQAIADSRLLRYREFAGDVDGTCPSGQGEPATT